MQQYKLFFADLHFHTHYSDNRDRASIEQMLQEGKKHGISILGIADHNHAFDYRKWMLQREEAAVLQGRYPDLLILHSCEITFLLGHFLVLEPESIHGTIAEGYQFLYRNSELIKVIAHPDPSKDEWHERIIPSVSAIEVINGSIFCKSKKAGLLFTSALDVPFIQMYSKYLSLGYPVAAIGNSDSHNLAEMGSALTGIWLKDPLRKADVLQAIRERRTFATTDPGIRILTRLDRERNEYSWDIEWNPLDSAVSKDYAVEVFNRGRKMAHTSGNGRVATEEQGLYWTAALNREAIVVSSPLYGSGLKEMPTRIQTIVKDRELFEDRKLFKRSYRDMWWLRLHQDSAPPLHFFKKKGSVEIEVLSRTHDPRITDADGLRVESQVMGPVNERIVIAKSCDPPCFDEFYLWLERNEIHEYMFLNIDYKKKGGLFIFDALIVPAKMVFRKNFRQRYRKELSRIKSLIDRSTRFQLHVRTVPKFIVRIKLDQHPFPLQVEAGTTSLKSLLLWIENELDEESLSRFWDGKVVPIDDNEPEQRIFQIFV